MKRDATPEESEAALVFDAYSFPQTRELRRKAMAEGFKDEVCGKCGKCFLAHKHFISCNRKRCDMHDAGAPTMLDVLIAKDEKETRDGGK